ncbi:MAG: hypothetical protein EXS00_09335 [Phycisphaerales bacterium]|nr:hypothetical protein [Phycisphaerales bacterium]
MSEDFAEIATKARAAIASQSGYDIIAVVNGGKKPWALAVVGACGTNARVAYGESPQSEVSVWSTRDPSRAQRIAYDFTPPLALHEVLACGNSVAEDDPDAQGKLIWDSTNGRMNLDRPALESDDKIDEKFRFAHEFHLKMRTLEDSPYPSTNAAMALQQKSVGKLREHLRRTVNGVLRRNRASQSDVTITPALAEADFTEQDLVPFVGAVRALLERARNKVATREAKMAVGKPAPPIGHDFEHRVADAVVSYIEGSPNKCALASVWWGVKVRHVEAKPSQTDAEWDILLVHRNGVITCLECKTVAATKKDMDARRAMLSLRTSNLARLVLVIPGYTAFADQEWFKNLTVFGSKHPGALRLTRLGEEPRFLDRSVSPPTEAIIAPFDRQLDQFFDQYVWENPSAPS